MTPSPSSGDLRLPGTKMTACLKLTGLGAALLMLSSTAAEEKPGESVAGIWVMGQSLCDGSESLPVVTAEDTGWGNYAFLRGVRTWLPRDNSGTPEKRPNDQFQLVPLRAQANGGLGETVANGMADHLKSALLATAKGRAVNGPPHFLVACAGQGGRQIQELSGADLSTDPRTPESRRHGGGYYRTSLDDARRAVVRAHEKGMSFRMFALYWMQGEGNGGPTGGIVPTRWDAELPRSQGLMWYRDQLIAYRRQWSADLTEITGQRGELPMFTYQTLGPAGEAQLLAADSDPFIYVVGPHYAVPSAINSRRPDGRSGDAIHLSADGERWWGEQVGKVMHRVLHDGEDWQPLRPLSAKLDRDRASILIEFHVPRPPIMIDTNFLPRQEIAAGDGFSSLAGFQVRDAAGQLLALTGVEVDNPTRLRLRLAKPVSAEQTCAVSYGHPNTASLGGIQAVRRGPYMNGGPSEELVLAKRITDQVKALTDEGAFFVANVSTGAPARVPIRHLTEEGGAAVLRYDPRELRDATPFTVGQNIVAQRPFSYGNLRDSDSEPATHKFADSSYGTRAGTPYPLWNWCVLFSQLKVSEPQSSQ